MSKFLSYSALQPSVEPPLNEKLCKNHLHSVLQLVMQFEKNTFVFFEKNCFL